MFRKWKNIVCRPLKILDILITILVLGTTVFFVYYWKDIPEKVPLHWNFKGEIDDYAKPGSYIILIMMMYFFWAGHTLTKLFSIFDIKENLFGKRNKKSVTEEMEKKAYNLLFAMLWICDFLVQFMLAYIIVNGVLVRNLGLWYLPVSLLLLTADFVWFFIKIKNLTGRKDLSL